MGIEVDPEELQTTPRAAARALAGKRVLALTMPAIIEDLEGVQLCGESAEVVLIGGADETPETNTVFSYMNLARAFSEMARALVPGGLAALAFHVGDEVVHRTEWWGEAVVLDARFLTTDHVSALLREQELEVMTTTERDPYAPGVEYQSRRAYLIARRA